MAPAAKKLKKPNKTAPFKEYILYYMKRKGWNQADLVQCSRQQQSQVSKIINGKVQWVPMDVLICFILALQLNVKESIDLLARMERAFSPASDLHKTYIELIKLYSSPEKKFPKDNTMLNEADCFLRERTFPSLPNDENKL